MLPAISILHLAPCPSVSAPAVIQITPLSSLVAATRCIRTACDWDQDVRRRTDRLTDSYEHEMDLKSCDPGCRSHKKKEVTHGITLHATTSLHGNVERRNFLTIGVLSHQRLKERDDRVTGGHNNCCLFQSSFLDQVINCRAVQSALRSFCFIYAASSFCHVPYFCLLPFVLLL